jgi:hypothetical protein
VIAVGSSYSFNKLSTFNIPNNKIAIFCARNDSLCIARDCDTRYTITMSIKRSNLPKSGIFKAGLSKIALFKATII